MLLADRTVAVFGSSEPLADSPAYEQARAVGRLLALAGARVANGGYGGVMEGSSRGAREAGGSVLGVTCALFEARSANAWLSETVVSRDLFERTRLLIELSHAFIILPGKSGTIAELAFLWALDRARALGDKPVVLCGGSWPGLLHAMEEAAAIEPGQMRITSLASTPEEAVAEVIRRLGSKRAVGA